MKKRNRILSLLLAGVMALGLTACGASNVLQQMKPEVQR